MADHGVPAAERHRLAAQVVNLVQTRVRARHDQCADGALRRFAQAGDRQVTGLRVRAQVLQLIEVDQIRITSYNVCYTKLLRGRGERAFRRRGAHDPHLRHHRGPVAPDPGGQELFRARQVLV